MEIELSVQDFEGLGAGRREVRPFLWGPALGSPRVSCSPEGRSGDPGVLSGEEKWAKAEPGMIGTYLTGRRVYTPPYPPK